MNRVLEKVREVSGLYKDTPIDDYMKSNLKYAIEKVLDQFLINDEISAWSDISVWHEKDKVQVAFRIQPQYPLNNVTCRLVLGEQKVISFEF